MRRQIDRPSPKPPCWTVLEKNGSHTRLRSSVEMPRPLSLITMCTFALSFVTLMPIRFLVRSVWQNALAALLSILRITCDKREDERGTSGVGARAKAQRTRVAISESLDSYVQLTAGRSPAATSLLHSTGAVTVYARARSRGPAGSR